jgi:hypothetical protein
MAKTMTHSTCHSGHRYIGKSCPVCAQTGDRYQKPDIFRAPDNPLDSDYISAYAYEDHHNPGYQYKARTGRKNQYE